MRIIVNDIAASEKGALSVLLDFYEAVCEYDKENEYIFLLSDKYVQETKKIKVLLRSDVKRNPFKKIWFDLVAGRHYVNRLEPDVVLSLQNIITFGVKAPQAVYIHQSIPFQKERYFSFLKNEERKLAFIQHIVGRFICSSARKADAVIVQTKWMKEALLKRKISSEKIKVVRPGIKVPNDINKKNNWNPFHFFYPTSEYSYKNNDIVEMAANCLRREFGSDVRVEMTLEKTKKSTEAVSYVGRLSREELWQKYQSNTVVFASCIETIGLPLIEAMKCGTMILASDCPYAREVLEGYENAYFFDYHFSDELVNLMRKVVTGEIPFKECPQKSQNKERNSWNEVLDVLKDLGQKKNCANTMRK